MSLVYMVMGALFIRGSLMGSRVGAKDEPIAFYDSFSLVDECDFCERF
jgi:hypothetical protein